MTPCEQDLARQLEECREALRNSRHDNEGLRRENELLRQKIDLLIRRVFGSSSERLDKAQLELLLQLSQGATITPPEIPAPRRLSETFLQTAPLTATGEPAGSRNGD